MQRDTRGLGRTIAISSLQESGNIGMERDRIELPEMGSGRPPELTNLSFTKIKRLGTGKRLFSTKENLLIMTVKPTGLCMNFGLISLQGLKPTLMT